MNEIIFMVEGATEGGFVVRALGESISIEAETTEELKVMIRDAVKCHFDNSKLPRSIRLHFVKEEVLPV